MTFKKNAPVFNSIQILISNKLNILDNDEVLLLWAKIKSYFSNVESNSAYKTYDDIIPANFFSSSDKKMSIHDKCAIVIGKYIPLTTKKMFEDGSNSFPMVLPGVAKILSLTNISDISPITSVESLLVKSASQIIAIYETISSGLGLSSNNKRIELAKRFGANESGFIFDGDFYKDYKKNIQDKNISIPNTDKLLLLNIRRLIEYCATHSKQNAKIEESLRQYKIGQEIIYPARAAEFKDKKSQLETYLQKDMCKFLVERNILSFGKSIGRNQIDLYHKDISGEDFVIEAKVYSDKKSITLNNIRGNLVQLQSYMDQHHQPKGILAIYNLTNTLLMAPKKWLSRRIYILCINLCDLSASRRKYSIEIIESEAKVIDLIKVGKD